MKAESLNFGLAFKIIREDLKMSQEEVCMITEISQPALSQIENGKKRPSNKIFTLLCMAYLVPRVLIVIMATEDFLCKVDSNETKNILKAQLRNMLHELVEKKHLKYIHLIKNYHDVPIRTDKNAPQRKG